MASASDERVRGSMGVNISDKPVGAAIPGLKALELVENISGTCSLSWR